MGTDAAVVGADGLVVVDKPPGMTSHDVVARVRRLAGTRRVGHGGTLDPMATGVLMVGVGRGTRLLTYVVGSAKEYAATIRLGQATLTDDAEGEVVGGAPAGTLTEAAVRAGLVALTGELDQVPSAVSAVKVGGRRAYARVRAGEEVDLAARRVTVSRLDLLALRRDVAAGTVDLDVEVACSSGTYVRAIARDLGAALHVGGHLTALRRTAVGVFPLAEALSLAELEQRAPQVVTLPLAAAAARLLPRRDATGEQARVLGHGGRLPALGTTGPYAVFAPDGSLVAIVREEAGRARSEVVFAPSGPG
ncbi:MAG TPA: tRNA pseudouridine(55) synthase TruB [Micromonosporaceae bacterium]|nr:tRNA pseudouridine(55) synthase TruB [Micromonosporaceae bacterium]